MRERKMLKLCDKCGQSKRLDRLTNQIKNYKYLCRKCHMQEDGRMERWKKIRVGRSNCWYGKKRPEISEYNKKKFTGRPRPEHLKLKQKETMKMLIREGKISKPPSFLGKKHTQEYKNLMSQKLTKRLQNKEFKELMIKNSLRALFNNRPTSLERHMINIIQNNNLPYTYVGDGSFLIGGKNPDFININGEKILIEVRNKNVTEILNKETIEEYTEKRTNHFSKFGWKSIIFVVDKLDEREVLKTICREKTNLEELN